MRSADMRRASSHAFAATMNTLARKKKMSVLERRNRSMRIKTGMYVCVYVCPLLAHRLGMALIAEDLQPIDNPDYVEALEDVKAHMVCVYV